jgi:hypothetical protein
MLVQNQNPKEIHGGSSMHLGTFLRLQTIFFPSIMVNILWMGSLVGCSPVWNRYETLKQYFYTQSLNILSVNGKKVL